MNRKLTYPTLVLALTSLGAAQVIDGQRDGSYGSALAVQTVNSGFGNGSPDGGSELDAAYARISGGRLSVLLTGNLESNFNNIEIFIDSVAGGENVLSNTPSYGGATAQKFAGMTFDTQFAADYHLFAHHGVNGAHVLNATFANRMGGGSAQVPWSDSLAFSVNSNIGIGQINAGDVGSGASGSALSSNLLFALDNNNIGGVTAGTGAANQTAAAAVTTGFEFSVSLADIGNPAAGSEILISAMINGANHDYLSNQTLGGLPSGAGNLGGDGAGGFTGSLSGVDFTQFAGGQFFRVQVVPEPTTMAILGFAILPLLRRNRK